MPKNSTLQTAKREGTGKGVARKLRKNGRVPAVLYGRGTDSVHLSLDTLESGHLFHNISVDNTIVDLVVPGEKEPIRTLVREVQTHPWKADILHVDFLRIQEGVAVDMDVPVHLVGIPAGVRTGVGIVEQIIHAIPIRCIPSNIPASIDVDITELDLNDVMHVSDITFGEGIEVMIPQERTLCSVTQPKAEVEPEVEAEEGVEDELEGVEPDTEVGGDTDTDDGSGHGES